MAFTDVTFIGTASRNEGEEIPSAVITFEPMGVFINNAVTASTVTTAAGTDGSYSITVHATDDSGTVATPVGSNKYHITISDPQSGEHVEDFTSGIPSVLAPTTTISNLKDFLPPGNTTGLPIATKSRQAPMWDGTQWVADGVPRIVACPFTHDTPGLTSGVDIWVPQDGDILFDAWIEVSTAWDGTTPQADIGMFNGVTLGWFASLLSAASYSYTPSGTPPNASIGAYPLDSDSADFVVPVNYPFAGVRVGSWPMALSQLQAMATVVNVFEVIAGGGDGTFSGWWTSSKLSTFQAGQPQSGSTNQAEVLFSAGASRSVPLRFIDETPLKLVVSQSGLKDDPDPGAIQGAGTLFLLVATPAVG